MEHIKNNENFESCSCKNNYNENTFFESFGKNDEEIKKCNSCGNFDYDCGIMTCKKFS